MMRTPPFKMLKNSCGVCRTILFSFFWLLQMLKNDGAHYRCLCVLLFFTIFNYFTMFLLLFTILYYFTAARLIVERRCLLLFVTIRLVLCFNYFLLLNNSASCALVYTMLHLQSYSGFGLLAVHLQLKLKYSWFNRRVNLPSWPSTWFNSIDPQIILLNVCGIDILR